MASYIKKPLVIDAIQWFPDTVFHPAVEQVDGKWAINNAEGLMYLEPGDWIVTGIKGEQYRCSDDVFKRTYTELTTIHVDDI